MSTELPFHPTLTRWFTDTFTEPTAVQRLSWPPIAAGEHVLITAPTGSGKTLTAFLWSLSQFASGAFEPGKTRVLYISPLKALNNDIQRNLLGPLQQLTESYDFPSLTVRTRSGDTSQSDRQRMLRKPPDILITTPESLGLLLTSRRGRVALGHLDTVIIDEIHSIVDNRRGAQLMVNLERLADLAGEFQRIVLSATVSPLEQVAQYVAGKDARRALRQVQIIDTPGEKQIDFAVRFPEAARDAALHGTKIWEPLSASFREVIAGNHATLLFTNSRRLAEKITLKINDGAAEPIAYAHHGSLAREVRTEVESRLKQGELRAIVATNSLEMGIDIGALDEVVMVQSPPSVASTLQRIGRAGHSVGAVSRGTLFPTHAHDFLEAAVLGEAVAARDIEPQQLMRGPLDILAQIVISICATDPWPVDEVYDLVTRAAPYHELSRDNFELVVQMLTGRYAGSRIRELKPRLQHDRISGTIQATRGALLALYNSGGSIPDRGYYQMRHFETGGALGELDEEFVWEATVGQTFTLGTQNWQIHQITHNDVIVRPARPDSGAPPFWRSESFNRSFHFSNRITEYLETAEAHMAAGEAEVVQTELEERVQFEPAAALELTEYLSRQRAHTSTPLPHRHHLLLELVKTGPAGYRGPDDPQQLVIHTFWGGRLNTPWGLALQAAWQAEFGRKPEMHADNNAIVLQCREDPDPHRILQLVTPDTLGELLRQSLEGSGFFGARFRECAGRSLLLNKQRFNQRLPLWMSRLQAKKLMAQVKPFTEFPVLLETWRTCLDDEFDLPALIARLEELQQGVMQWSFVRTSSPSPFAHNLTFGQVSRYMYADDTPEDDALSALSSDLISHALHNEALRPTIDPEVVRQFEEKRQRRSGGYEPLSPDDWEEWLKERVLLPQHELPEDAELPERAQWVDWNGRRWVTHAELSHALYSTGLIPGEMPADTPHIPDERDAVQLAREVLSFYGPLSEEQIAQLLPTVPEGLLSPTEQLIYGPLVTGVAEELWCDAENFEALMRFQRAARRAAIEPVPAQQLPEFWALLQNFGMQMNETNLINTLEVLRGYPAGLQIWLQDLLTARLGECTIAELDQAMAGFGIGWLGTGKESMTFAYPEEFALLTNSDDDNDVAALFNDPAARYNFDQLLAASSLDRTSFNDTWWQAVWQGQLSADSLLPLQQGVERKFSTPDLAQATSSRRRLARGPMGWPGNWQLLCATPAEDPLTQLEADKDRVRLLLDRYGLVNRELVNREGLAGNRGPWRWRDAFRALRVMELAGEVTSGMFCKDLATPQFITPRALSLLQNNTPAPQTFWMAAHDPASPCGLGLDWEQLVQRRAGNYLAFHEGQLALTVEGYGKTLVYHLPWEHAGVSAVNELLEHLGRHHGRINVASINAEPARSSPYVAALRERFDVANDHKGLYLQTRY